MKKLDDKQSGFSAVEILMVILAIVLIGGVGFLVYHKAHHKKETSAYAAYFPNASSHAWTKYTTHFDRISLTYPASWRRYTSNSFTGNDDTSFLSPDGFTMFITADPVAAGLGSNTAKVLSSQPIVIAGVPAYLDFYNASVSYPSVPANYVEGLDVSASPTTYSDPVKNGIEISVGAHYLDKGGEEPLTKAKINQDYIDAERVVRSISMQ
jgi:hypothetical protein